MSRLYGLSSRTSALSFVGLEEVPADGFGSMSMLMMKNATQHYRVTLVHNMNKCAMN